MKVFITILVACLVATAFAQGQSAAAQAAVAQAAAAAAAGGAAGSAAASAGRQSLFGSNPILNMAAMTGQLGDGFQSMMQCNMLGLPPFLCFGMQ